MKTATFVFLLAVWAAVIHAQTSATPSGDVAIKLSDAGSEYCLGFLQGQGPDDITLRLPLRLRYENHRSETIMLPSGHSLLWRLSVAGQNDSTILRQGDYGMDLKANDRAVMAMSRPDISSTFRFTTISGSKAASSTLAEPTVLKFQDTVYHADFVMIPVLVRSSGVDLRGKTVQIVTRRDFRSITPEVVAKLNEKWKDYGTVWTGVVDSEMTFQIPQQPPARKCGPKPLPR
jgi:hypothetical protein